MLVSLRPPHTKPSPPTGQVLIAAFLDWLRDAPENIVADMKLLHQQREDAASLLERGDALRSELNQEIATLNARDELLRGRESALERREKTVADAEQRLRATIAALRSA
jgi:hypothetical protein